jgi:hypothetical protein
MFSPATLVFNTVPVAYGANNSFVFMNVTNLTACNSSTFGTDPAPGVPKTCSVPTIPPGYAPCAVEGGTCYIDTAETVAFGANGKYVFLPIADNQQLQDPPPQVGISCSLSTFLMDPAPGVPKRCYVPAPPQTPFQFCSMEGDACQFVGPVQIAFGGNGNYVYQEFAQGPVSCKSDSDHFFGEDPAPGTRKKCYVAVRNLPPDGYTWCANENGICFFNGPVKVAYGAPGLGNYVFKTLTIPAPCINSVFGVDPAFGFTKACFIPTAPTGFAPSGNEGENIYVRGGTTVAFGAVGKYVFQNISGSQNALSEFTCDYAQFHSDPAPGVPKTCSIPAGPDGTYNCSPENGQCVSWLDGVAYFGFNDLWVAKTFPVGSPFACTTDTFGQDPAPGIPKACFVKSFPFQ